MTHDSSLSVGLYVGIDVSKDKLDLACSDQNEVLQFANNPTGIAAIVAMMKEAKPVLIVIEATGGLERPLVGALLDEDLPAALVHPGRVRNMARALNINAKSDKIDARVLYLFGQKAQPRISRKASKNRQELSDLVTCRRQLITTRVQQSNRLGSSYSSASRKSIHAVISTLDRQIEKLDRQIRRLIDADDDFRDLEKILLSVPGVGPTLTATLLADLPELGQLDRQPVCAIVGVAPFVKESGNYQSQRNIRGGRAHVRNVLYMNAITAIRCNPVIQAFAHRLQQKNKRSKVVIVAAMRKLLSLINVMVRDGLLWHELDVVKKLSTAP
jgi:transposase